MAVVYNTTLKNTRLQDVIDACGAAATLDIYTSAYGSLLASIPLANPMGTKSGGVLTFSGTPLSDSSANASGTAAIAKIVDGSAVDIVNDLTVGTSGANINLSTTSIVSGQPVTITSASITHG
jgi:hypothetical protein